MSEHMIRDFIKHQATLMSHVTVVKSDKTLVRPEVVVAEAATPEEMYNEIIKKKLGKKKVMVFLQAAIDSLLDDE